MFAGNKDLLTGPLEPEDIEKDDLSLLNEILNAPSTGEDEFTQEWQAVFGGSLNITPDTVPAERDSSRQQAEFMPSSLLDSQLAGLSLGPGQWSTTLTSDFTQSWTYEWLTLLTRLFSTK